MHGESSWSRESSSIPLKVLLEMSSSELSERFWTLICVVVVLLFIAAGVELSSDVERVNMEDVIDKVAYKMDVTLKSAEEVDIGTTGVSGFTSG